MTKASKPGPPEAYEAWFAFLARVCSFILGVLILVHQELFSRLDLWGVAIGAALMGPATAAAVAQIVAAARGGGRT